MNLYKIKKQGWIGYLEANSLNEVNEKCKTLKLLDGLIFEKDYFIELFEENIILNDISLSEKINNYIDFGKKIILEFRKDTFGIDMDADTVILILKEFEDIEKLLNNGILIHARTKLLAFEVNNIFTQELKDKYINMISNHLKIYE